MLSSADTLKAEAAWYRSIAERLESIASEITGGATSQAQAQQPTPEAKQSEAPQEEPPQPAPEPKLLQLPSAGGFEFHGLVPSDAVTKAIATYGPLRSGQILERLSAGGLRITRAHVYTILARKRGRGEILRDEDTGEYTRAKAAIAI